MKFQCQACQGLIQIDFDDPMVNCGICNAICEVPPPFGPSVVIDDFMIIKLLGEGGMGSVYLAHQFSLDREVALKILKGTIAENEQFRNEFIKEARSVASLNHQNIIQAYKVGIDDDILFFAMEYVEGQTLQDLLKQDGALMEMQVLSFAQDIAVALGYAWEKRQLVHRDIKPENIMLANDGHTKLMDLGLSCHAGEDDGDDDKISGTPQYISPEQILGDAIDIRTDFYCLGASLYHLLSGGFPFEGNLREMVQKHLKEPPPNLKKKRPDLNTATIKLVHKLMNKDPDDRFPSSEALLKEIVHCKKLLIDDKKGKKHFSYNKTKHSTKALSKSKVLNEPGSTSRNKPKSSGLVKNESRKSLLSFFTLF